VVISAATIWVARRESMRGIQSAKDMNEVN
jgi:hypothetical protein